MSNYDPEQVKWPEKHKADPGPQTGLLSRNYIAEDGYSMTALEGCEVLPAEAYNILHEEYKKEKSEKEELREAGKELADFVKDWLGNPDGELTPEGRRATDALEKFNSIEGTEDE